VTSTQEVLEITDYRKILMLRSKGCSFPGKHKSGSRYVEPYYPYIHRELAKPGVTMALLWEEYCRKCYEAGETPYMSTQFGDKYRKWVRVTKATMRIQHKPGDAIQVDWAGDTLSVYMIP